MSGVYGIHALFKSNLLFSTGLAYGLMDRVGRPQVKKAEFNLQYPESRSSSWKLGRLSADKLEVRDFSRLSSMKFMRKPFPWWQTVGNLKPSSCVGFRAVVIPTLMICMWEENRRRI